MTTERRYPPKSEIKEIIAAGCGGCGGKGGIQHLYHADERYAYGVRTTAHAHTRCAPDAIRRAIIRDAREHNAHWMRQLKRCLVAAKRKYRKVMANPNSYVTAIEAAYNNIIYVEKAIERVDRMADGRDTKPDFHWPDVEKKDDCGKGLELCREADCGFPAESVGWRSPGLCGYHQHREEAGDTIETRRDRDIRVSARHDEVVAEIDDMVSSLVGRQATQADYGAIRERLVALEEAFAVKGTGADA